MKLFKGEIRAPEAAKVLIPKANYEWMHQKMHLTRIHYKYRCTRRVTLQ